MRINKLILFAFLIIFSLFIVSAANSFTFPANQNATISVPVFDENNNPADATINCNITIRSPNNTIIINNGLMTSSNNDYIFVVPGSNLSQNGEYTSSISCSDGTTSGFSTFTFEVNPTGISSTDAKTTAQSRGIIALFAIALLLFFGFLYANSMPVKTTLLLFCIIFIVAGFNIVFITMKNEAVTPELVNLFDKLSAFSFYFYWFAGGLILLLWIYTFFNTYVYKKNEKMLERMRGIE